MMELLSPAGSREALIAAVQNGADAVYFGGSMFNARRFAANFDDHGLISAIDYCHERGVKVNITLNTLLLDKEISQALKYAEFLCRTGADAAIVQDMGLVSLIRKNIPELPLHASTQMGIHELNGAREAEKMGLEQVVLSREVPLGEIEYIHNNTPIALEAFAHGALCMSFSGACLLSSMAGERSGNRGTCAQPCRKRMGLDAIAWARRCQELGAGELCVNSIDADGTKDGYELNLTRQIVEAVSIPVIASGGAGNPEHMLDAVTKGKASAALIASIVHYGQYTIRQCKEFMASHGVPMRMTW